MTPPGADEAREIGDRARLVPARLVLRRQPEGGARAGQEGVGTATRYLRHESSSECA